MVLSIFGKVMHYLSCNIGSVLEQPRGDRNRSWTHTRVRTDVETRFVGVRDQSDGKHLAAQTVIVLVCLQKIR